LKVILSSPRPQYQPGEPVSLTLALTNNGKQEFVYPRPKLRDLVGLTVTGPDGKAVKHVLNPVEISFAGTQVTVKPGETVTVEKGLQGVNLPKAGTAHYLRHTYYPMDTPGEYRLRFRVGKTVSNELRIVVAPAKEKRQAGAGKGLKVVLGSDRLQYRAGEPVSLTLTLTNNDKQSLFCMRPSLQVLDGLTVVSPGGKEVKPVSNRAQINFSQKAVTVPAGGSAIVKNELRDINLPKAALGGHIRPSYYPMDEPGEYRLRFRVLGVDSNELRIKILPREPGKVESKAVRVEGVDFRVVVDAKVKAPAAGAGGKQPLSLGLRITNHSGKPFRFNLYDTVWRDWSVAGGIELRTSGGKSIQVGGGRKDSRPALPVLLETGESTMVWGKAHLEWLKGATSLRLSGEDGSGGYWYFDGLTPGKYRLRIRYENTAKQTEALLRDRPAVADAGPPFWVGKAGTAEVEFEITPP
jgi:hypothetical protein